MKAKRKVLLPYQAPSTEQPGIESIWATQVGENYKLDNVPFLAKNFALGDVVSVDNSDGALYVDSLVQASGHGVVQVILFEEDYIQEFLDLLTNLQFYWEQAHNKRLIAVDVPNENRYKELIVAIRKWVEMERLDYREACLGW